MDQQPTEIKLTSQQKAKKGIIRKSKTALNIWNLDGFVQLNIITHIKMM